MPHQYFNADHPPENSVNARFKHLKHFLNALAKVKPTRDFWTEEAVKCPFQWDTKTL